MSAADALMVGILLFFVYMSLHGVVKATPSLTPFTRGSLSVGGSSRGVPWPVTFFYGHK